MPFHAAVASAKGAIEGLTRSLAAEFAPKIRVNSIAMSLTDTKMAERFLSSDAKLEASRNRHPMKEVGQPEDMAAITEFLLGSNAKWVTGQVIGADGGIGTLRTS
jgi:NAD(P)-dependent dehydrogenase (short-subunit alcohol dehydrogenase family)